MRVVRPINARTLFTYRDELVLKQRRALMRRLYWGAAAFAILVGGLVYLFFFSSVFRVRDVVIDGIDQLNQENVRAWVSDTLDRRSLKMFQLKRNIVFLNADDLKAQLSAQYPVLRDVSVRKEYFHTLIVSALERTAIGTWCFNGDCVYFDQDGKPWGQAPVSSGFVLLTVLDLRATGGKVIDGNFLAAIRNVAGGLSRMGIKTRSVTIPENSVDEFRVAAAGGLPAGQAGYDILFSLDSDYKGQLDVLRVFLDQKGKDPAFDPLYFDLRIDGRVYFKIKPAPTPSPSGIPA